MDRAMRRLRILVLMHPDFVPPDSTEGYTARQINEWKTEYDVVSTLRAAGHEVHHSACRRKSSRCATRSKVSSRMWYSTCSSSFTMSPCMTSTFQAISSLCKSHILGAIRVA